MNSAAIKRCVLGATKKWAKQRKAEERRWRSAMHRRDTWASSSLTQREVAFAIMADAYRKASGDGQYPAHARQIMYAARGEIQEKTGKALRDQYFTQRLLPEYMEEHPDETADWWVVFDDRGHLSEPHTGRNIGLGTLKVQDYLARCTSGIPEVDVGNVDALLPTNGPSLRYSAVLFIEKEGFMPLLQKAQIAERFDVAIMSTKGMSNTAARSLIDELNVPVLVVRDFDKAGFSIVATLRTDTRRYTFQSDIEVIDLGLRLDDVRAYRLEDEGVGYGKSDPRPNLRTNGATDEEIEFLVRSGRTSFRGRRVELNAFTSDQLIEWLESKLEEAGIEKVIPDEQVLVEAYRRAAEISYLNRKTAELAGEAKEYAAQSDVPDNLTERVENHLVDYPDMPWDSAVAELVAEDEENRDESE